ncbi:MAG: hypothetical protein H8E30_10245 [Alphaproteobacteria bacterium]|nr:hypothetical protein [Alphaproteobacteria bacterium]
MRLFAALLILTSVIGLGLTPVGLYVGGAYAGSEGPAEFFSGIEDFPLMPGLTELPDATLVFDSPSGRFVEAYATGLASPAEMARFYSSSLPQLGWRATGGASYQREGEVLEIEIVGPAADDGTRTVRFAISPAGNDVTGD